MSRHKRAPASALLTQVPGAGIPSSRTRNPTRLRCPLCPSSWTLSSSHRPPPQLHLPALGRALSPQPQSALPMEPGACHLPERREPATGTWQCGNPCHLSPGTQSTRAANRTHLQDRGCPTPDLGPLSPQLLHHHSNVPWVARRVGHKWMGTKIHPKFHLSSQTLTWGCNPPRR